jgi:predicted TPR repeat methyltransferase
MTDRELSTRTAYALETAEDRKALYADWAATYDDSFAKAADYIFPCHVARVFHARGGDGPVLDAGAGTGLVAQAIRARGAVTLDAFDLSPEMLEVARAKGLYRNLIEGDLTETLPFATATYRAVVSAGTFTHGHVGPEALDELVRVAASGAIFVLSIKADLYASQGFEAKFAQLAGRITALDIEEVPIYGPQTDEEHASDIGLIASFRRN